MTRQLFNDRRLSFGSWTCVCSAVTVHWTPTESDLAARRSTTLVSLHITGGGAGVGVRKDEMMKGHSKAFLWAQIESWSFLCWWEKYCLFTCYYLWSQQNVAEAHFLLSVDTRNVLFLCRVWKLQSGETFFSVLAKTLTTLHFFLFSLLLIFAPWLSSPLTSSSLLVFLFCLLVLYSDLSSTLLSSLQWRRSRMWQTVSAFLSTMPMERSELFCS